MKTAVVTDTNSGIFPERGKQLGIYVVPMPVIGCHVGPNAFGMAVSRRIAT